MNELRISLIIPAYNEERYLVRCLDSVAAQITPFYEVIVVDNDSTDKTAEIARRYSFVTVLHESHRGRIFAQNAGFNSATGTILARIDADAVLPSDWTDHVLTHFNRPEMLQTGWTSGALFYNVRLPRLVSSVYDWIPSQFNQLLTGHPSLWGSSMALPTVLWKQVKDEVCKRSDLHEDLDLSIHLHRHGYSIVYDPRVKVAAELRPAYASAGAVWRYLQMWPRTLAVHNIWSWPVCWIVNAVVFMGMPFFGISERIAQAFQRLHR